MEILNNYIHFLNSLLINQNIFIPDQFIIPIFFIFHILFIFILYFFLKKSQKRWRIKASFKYLKKIENITGENEFQLTIGYLRKIDPFIFEEMILSRIKLQGYKIYRNKRYTGDGGIDGKFKYNRKLYYIQAKRYKSYITKSHVIEFDNLIKKKKVKGLFVHTGKTGKGSKNLESQNMTFLSGKNMILFLKNKKDISDII